jgi:hypothetical protein
MNFPSFPKSDGVIYIATNSCCCPPGPRRAGQHTNATTHWYQIIPSGGITAPWKRIRKSLGEAMTFAECAITCAEFEEAMGNKMPGPVSGCTP